MKKYCLSCGSLLGDDGICSNTSCKRRVLQTEAKEKRALAVESKAQEDNKRVSARSTLKVKALDVAKVKAKAINLNIRSI